MYLKQTKRPNGDIYLSFVEGYRVKNGPSRTKTVESLGSVSKLKLEHDDPVAYFKKECDRRNAEAAAQKAKSITITLSDLEKMDERECPIDLGAAVILSYLEELGIPRFFKNRSFRCKAEYDQSRIMELLVSNRILDPGSKKAAFEGRDSFPRKCDFSLDDVYRALDEFADQGQSLVSFMGKSLEESRGGRDTTCVYYDVTNFFFESEEDEDGLRRCGCSKEHRPNPIVQMGLMLDADGIPMAYDLFQGNTNDCLTMMPVMRASSLREHEGRAIIVADKGLNTSDNIAACILDGNGYVFSQSVRKADATLKSWVLDQDGYDVRSGFKIKSKLADKTIAVRDRKGNIIRTEQVPVRLVAFWSADYDARAKHKRAKALAKAEKMVSERAGYEHAKKFGAGRYVRERNVDAETGELTQSVVELDWKAIEKDEALDGYYCLVTSEEDKTPDEIIDIYRGLWQIEDSFRVTKSDLEGRPVFVWTDAHIRAHFLVCFIALTVIRLIQRDTKNKYSATKIAKALSGLKAHHIKENWYLAVNRNKIIDSIGRACGMDLTRKFVTKQDINTVVAQAKKKR